MSRAAVAGAALALAVVVGAFLVFQPSAATSSGAIVWLSRHMVDLGVPYHRASDVIGFSLNVALFVPGAAAAALLWRRVRWWQWILLGFLVSAGIETVQGLFFASRDAEVRDLVSNTLGAALGSGAVLFWRSRTHT